jgi:O-antigen chain-terminating methyltransferase
MRRTLEKLAAERQGKEDEFLRRLEELRRRLADDRLTARLSQLEQAVARLDESAVPAGKEPVKKGLLGRRSGGSQSEPQAADVRRTLQATVTAAAEAVRETRETAAGLADLVTALADLTDARDREWDALGSNHVGMIFKSMEWRVDKLAAEAEDAGILMKTFIRLREKLDSLLAVLEKGERPSPADVRALVAPLEDWRYAGFENRFRGTEDEIRRQQARYVPYFPAGGKVLDLGCGRGEFLELLRERGIAAEGVDLNSQMADICLDKGLLCERKDILEKLAEQDNDSLGGVFSSQVVEHLPPDYLRSLVQVAHLKLAPGGALVLETVNPTSVFALVQIYFLDLSHKKPLHPQALKFLVESAGFTDVEVLFSEPLKEERLQALPGADETSAILNADIDALNRLLFAPPNYAVVARRA